MAQRLIVGLGNPGHEYHHTRHNIGWDLLDTCRLTKNLLWREKFNGLYAEFSSQGEKIYVLRPMTYMNLSGESVLALSKFFKVEREDILVLHDELDLPFGTLTFKKGGGLAGHNGLKSISKCMGGNDFNRLRLGIGRPTRGSVSDWVLSHYSEEDELLFGNFIGLAAEALEQYIDEGFARAAGSFSKKSIIN